MSPAAPNFIPKLQIVVIGGGQAGLSSAYHLRELGLVPDRDFTVLDRSPRPGGAWQFRWPSLTLSTVNGVHDLPGGLSLGDGGDVRASEAVPLYFEKVERAFDLPVHRPVSVLRATDRSGRFRIETDRGTLSAAGIINATGTWDAPQCPVYPGSDCFEGRQLHAHDYRTPDAFAGQRVIVVGGGISAIQLLEEISRVATTIWVTRRPPEFHNGPFTPQDGRAAVARVEARVREGLPPGSLVSATGLPPSAVLDAARGRGVLKRLPMFSEITGTGVRWQDGRVVEADVILWATGFGNVLAHLEELGLKNDAGGIKMTGRLATQVEADPRIHLVGYGPSASTIGANRAGRAAAEELTQFLGIANLNA